MSKSFSLLDLAVLYVGHSQPLWHQFKQQVNSNELVIKRAKTSAGAVKTAQAYKYLLVVIDVAAAEANLTQSIGLIETLHQLLPQTSFVLVTAGQQQDCVLLVPSHLPVRCIDRLYGYEKLTAIFNDVVNLHQQRVAQHHYQEMTVLKTKIKSLSLLFLEDNPADVELMRACWDEWRPGEDSILTHCDTMADALDLLANNSYSLILTDLNLPDSHGLNTVSSL